MSLRKTRESDLSELLEPTLLAGGGSDSRPIAVLLDDAAESWHALFAALTLSRREGREMRALLVRRHTWIDVAVNALQVPYPMALCGVPTTAWDEVRAEYDDALRAQGFGTIGEISSKRELIRDLTATPASLVVCGMAMGRSLQGPLGRRGQALLLIP